MCVNVRRPNTQNQMSKDSFNANKMLCVLFIGEQAVDEKQQFYNIGKIVSMSVVQAVRHHYAFPKVLLIILCMEISEVLLTSVIFQINQEIPYRCQ